MAFRSLRFSPRQQEGNTLVGFIIGLVIGLVIAVVVALSITKGQTPFTDKAPKNGKPTDEASGQIADPNKPMYGSKDAVKKANSEFERETSKQAPADQLQKVVDSIQAQGQAPAKAPATPAPAAAPTPAPATTSPAAPPPVNSAAPPAQAAAPAPALPGEDKFVYYLQAGAFREVGDAENTRAKLALLGFEATVSDRATDAGVLHRVRMGPFTQVEAMNKVRAKLSENGIDVAVVRNQK
jgi:cell division protein FtsN